MTSWKRGSILVSVVAVAWAAACSDNSSKGDDPGGTATGSTTGGNTGVSSQPAECPRIIPGDGSSCPSAVGTTCRYGSSSCACNGVWQCESTLGTTTGGTRPQGTGGTGTVTGATVPDCPEEVPDSADGCTGTGNCLYDDATCVCAQGQWVCQAVVSCPAEAPQHRSECTMPRQSCRYEAGECTCQNDPANGFLWNCADFTGSTGGFPGFGGTPSMGGGGRFGMGGSENGGQLPVVGGGPIGGEQPRGGSSLGGSLSGGRASVGGSVANGGESGATTIAGTSSLAGAPGAGGAVNEVNAGEPPAAAGAPSPTPAP